MKYSFLKKNIFYTENNKNFLTPKKMALMIISGSAFIGFAVLSFILLDMNFIEIFTSIGINIQQAPMLGLYLVIAILCPFARMLYTIWYIRPAMVKSGIHISALEYILLAFKVFFFNTITPFATGGEPYLIYWIKSRGGSIKLASSLTLVSMIVGGLGQIFLTLPSFIIISMDYARIIALHASSMNGAVIYWFIVGGLLLNIIILSIWVVMGISKKFHYTCSRMTNWVLRKIKRPYLSHDEMYQKYIVEAEFQAVFYAEARKWKRNLIIILWTVFNDVFLYVAVFFSFALVSPNFEINGESFWNMFNITNVSLTANNFIPIPSGEGTIQLTIGTLSTLYFTNAIGGIYNSIGFWKIITNYLPLVFSIAMMGWYYLFKLILINKFTGMNIKTKYDKDIVKELGQTPSDNYFDNDKHKLYEVTKPTKTKHPLKL